MNDAFHKQQIAETNRILTQDEDAPQLGVHVMGETVYCDRAARIAVESREEDTGSEFIPAPALGGIPTHDIDKLEGDLEQITDTLKKVGGIMGTAMLAAPVGYVFDPNLGFALAGGAVAAAGVSVHYWWGQEVKRYFEYKRLLRKARRALQREPNWSLDVQQEVRWWELIQSGFDSRTLDESLYNPDINLKGRPWRILRRGSVHLPILRIRVEDYDPRYLTQVKLTEQRRARLAAYAFLIETCHRAQANWAIVMFNNSFDGLAVPLNQHFWRPFRDGMLKARAEMRKARDDPRYRPEAPEGRRQCASCPFGKPRRVGIKPTVLGGTQLPAMSTSDREGRAEFHSTCGDRFGDVPPHNLADELGLLDRS